MTEAEQVAALAALREDRDFWDRKAGEEHERADRAEAQLATLTARCEALTAEQTRLREAQSVSLEVLNAHTIAGARAFWALKDLEAVHEHLRVEVMTVASDPHLTWEVARQRLLAALSSTPTPEPNK